MEEDIDTRKINNSFLRDHSYATEADIISTVEFNHTGELLATGDKGGRVVIFQREQESKNQVHRRGEYNVYSTFQSHEPEFDYLKSLEIEEKINKIRWLPQQNAAYFLLSTNGAYKGLLLFGVVGDRSSHIMFQSLSDSVFLLNLVGCQKNLATIFARRLP
uniref:Protein phosphatase 2 regulatory subunit Bbeta n=1 Tax=Myotis myotis TaxID=51298 RepID=A0A7J7XJH5_MYOMY|nr:protein phosphatase 2 regulatory subunit Bbeta [Myotis myotis]